jgi:hypothetical protein
MRHARVTSNVPSRPSLVARAWSPFSKRRPVGFSHLVFWVARQGHRGAASAVGMVVVARVAPESDVGHPFFRRGRTACQPLVRSALSDPRTALRRLRGRAFMLSGGAGGVFARSVPTSAWWHPAAAARVFRLFSHVRHSLRRDTIAPLLTRERVASNRA